MEIDMFCEEPLAVDKVTIRLRSSEEAKEKLKN